MSAESLKNASAAELQSMFAASVEKSDEASKLSTDEKNKFQAAFEDPEFRKMFADYVDELQDPANRAETEAYISQLEGEEKVPQGKELIRPRPGFVAKTFKLKEDNSKGDKLWVNIVASEKISEPVRTNVKGGQSWSLPYSVGPPRMEKDKTENLVTCFDCCFHPAALNFGQQMKAIQDLLIKTAFEGIEESYKRMKQPVKLAKDYHILKGVTYKTGDPATMLIATQAKETWNNTNKANEKEPATGESQKGSTTEKIEKDVGKGKKKAKGPGPAVKKGFLLGGDKDKKRGESTAQKEEDTRDSIEKSLIEELPDTDGARNASASATSTSLASASFNNKTNNNDDLSKGPLVPNHEIVERGVMDLGDFNNSQFAKSTRPKELVVKIALPKLLKSQVSMVDLDIAEKTLSLKYKDVYDLSLRLPYPVDESAGKAKFDKSTSKLVVTLPVLKHMPASLRANLPPAPPEENEAIETAYDAGKDDDKGIKEEKIPSPSQRKESARFQEEAVSIMEYNPEGNKSGLSDFTQEEKDASQKLKEEIAAAARAAKENALKQKEEEAKNPNKSQGNRKIGGTVAPMGESLLKDMTEFIAAPKFTGAKEGYFFKRDKQGLGYYLDRKSAKVVAVLKKKQEEVIEEDDDSDKEEESDTDDGNMKESPEPGSTSKKSNLKKQSSYTQPVFQYQQNEDNIAIVIQIPNIQIESVFLYGTDTTVQMYFESIQPENSTVKTDIPAGTVIPYSVELYLRPSQDDDAKKVKWEVNKCRFDVVKHNMVLVMMKKKEGVLWTETFPHGLVRSQPYDHTGANKERRSNITNRVDRDSVRASDDNREDEKREAAAANAKEDNKNEKEAAATSNNDKKDAKVDIALVKQISDMNMGVGSKAALFELV
jgi:hypothetical protein